MTFPALVEPLSVRTFDQNYPEEERHPIGANFGLIRRFPQILSSAQLRQQFQDAEHPCDLSGEDAKLLGLDARVACEPWIRDDLLVHVQHCAFVWNRILEETGNMRTP